MNWRLLLPAAAILGAAGAPQAQTRVVPAPAAPARAHGTAFERQMQNARDAGDGDYELRALRQKVAAAPDDVAARLELAAAYRRRGYPDVALEICRLAAARFPQCGEAELALARSLRDSQQRNEAISSLGAFLQAHPQSGPQYDSWLGILHDESGQFAAGEPAHRRAIELAPSQDYLHNNLGYNLLMQKKSAGAAAEFREALRLYPASQVVRNNLGTALASQNDTREALASWQAAADPAAAHNNLAAVLFEKGNYSEARKELELALGYNKAYSAALKNLELVSRLDGNAATLPAGAVETRWGAMEKQFCQALRGAIGRHADRVRGNQRGTMKAFILSFVRDEQGQDLVEYVLIVAAIELALITTVNQLSQGIASLYQSMTGDLASIGTPGA